MTETVNFILFLWVFSEINFLVRSGSKISSDFGHTKEEAKTLTECDRRLQDAENRFATAEQQWSKLRPLMASTKRRKDGRFDERSKAGKMLNREVPRVKKLRTRAVREKAAAKKKFVRIESLPARRARGWSRAASARAACRQGLVALPLLILASGHQLGATPGDRAATTMVLWGVAVVILSLGYHASTKGKLRL